MGMGWFLADNLPTHECQRHVLCDYDAEWGGISHGACPEESLERIALLDIVREFPTPIYVTDAQYTMHGNPCKMPQNPDPTRAYFDTDHSKYHATSHTKEPFNRSCQRHAAA